MNKFPVSFSRLSTFEQCELKFEYLYVNKSVVDNGSEATVYGTRVHEALENYGVALTQGEDAVTALLALEGPKREAGKWYPMVDKINAQKGDKYYEFQMALAADKTVCDWFSPDVWLRGIADVLVINGDTAWCGDWKTGKVKENPTQLQVFAALVFIHFPGVQKVQTSFIWLAHNQITNSSFTRNMLPHIWGALDPRFTRYEEAIQLGVFKPNPSPLCGWCPAQDICQHKKTRR